MRALVLITFLSVSCIILGLEQFTMKKNSSNKSYFQEEKEQNCWIHYDSENEITLGRDQDGIINIATKYTSEELFEYDNGSIKKIKYYIGELPISTTVKIFELNEGETPDNFPLFSIVEEDLQVGSWNETVLDTPLVIDAELDYWVVISFNVNQGTYCAGADNGPAIAGKSDFVSIEDEELSALSEISSFDINWNIRMLVEPAQLDHNVGIISFDNFNNQIDAGEEFYPEISIQNTGLNAEIVDLQLTINDVSNNEIYNETIINLSINSNEIVTQEFPEVVDENGKLYYATATVMLPSDMFLDDNVKYCEYNTWNIEKDKVLIELATGTWGSYDPGAAMGIQDLRINSADVAVISYHGGDYYQTYGSIERLGYYDIASYPTAVFDGLDVYVGGHATESMYDEYLELYETSRNIKVPFSINYFKNNADSSLIVNVIKEGEISNDSLRIFSFVTESNINYNWQNQNLLHDVFRTSITDISGESVTFNSPSNQYYYNAEVNIDSEWNLQNTKIISFVQDVSTKEVFQCKEILYEDIQYLGNPIAYGDIDANGIVQAYDASLTLKHSVGLDPIPEIDPIPWVSDRFHAADVDQNNEIQAYDASLILQKSIGLIEDLPIIEENRIDSEGMKVQVELVDQELIVRANDPISALEIALGNQATIFDVNYIAENAIYELNENKISICSFEDFNSSHSITSFIINSQQDYVDATITVNNYTYEERLFLNSVNCDIEGPHTELIGNEPNPFNPTTNISFSLNKDSIVKLYIYNIKGQKVKTLVNGDMKQGNHVITWNGTDNSNNTLGSGVYFYKMQTNNFNQVRKMMLLK